MEEKKESAAKKVHLLLALVLKHIVELDLSLEVEPEGDIQPGDTVIGSVSDQVKRLYALRRRMSKFGVQSIEDGLNKILEEFLIETKTGISRKEEISDGQRILGRVQHPQNIALSHISQQILKWAVVFDAMDPNLFNKEIDVRKGWVAVWFEKEPEPKPA